MAPYDLFLNKNLSKYKHHDLVRTDMRFALETYDDLVPKMESFTYDDGRTQSLACLEGTIPVTYYGKTYNIPVCIFIREDHPYSAPMAYVRPTSTMKIKPSQYVEMNGRVTLPYLSEWQHEQSDLTGLLAVLQVVFGERSPVFSKSASTASQPPYTNNPTPSSAYTGAMPMPHGGAFGFGFSPPTMTPNDGSKNMPGLPFMPPIGGGWGMPHPQRPPNLFHPEPSMNPPYRQPAMFANNPTFMDSCSTTNTVTEEHLRVSLLSSVQDKIRHLQREVMYQHQDELQSLKQTQSDLRKGSQSLEVMMRDMDKELERVTELTRQLTGRNAELEEMASKLDSSSKETINVDEAVNASAPLYRQLFSAFAEEQAIEDAMYQLGEAFGKGLLDFDLYLKKIRDLSRKQFMLRSTVQLCREKAGLPCV